MGPNETELRKVLRASSVALDNASKDWESGRSALDSVTDELEKGISGLDEEMGVRTREAALASFRAMHDRVRRHKVSLSLGRDALSIASAAIEKATNVANTGLPGLNSAPTRTHTGDSAADEVDFARQVRAYDLSVTSRETAAATALKDLDDELDKSIAKMREARGEPPEDPSGASRTTTGGSVSSPTRTHSSRPVSDYTTPGHTTGTGTGTGTGDPTYPDHHGTGGPDQPDGHHLPGPHLPGSDAPGSPHDPDVGDLPGSDGHDVDDGSPVGGLPGGVSGAVGGAILGGGSLVGALRGMFGVRGASTPSTGGAVAPAASTRTAGGVMGRSAATGAGRGRAGSRAGGRGAGAGMGGRNGRKGKGRGRARPVDKLVEDEAWLDDEDTGPDVLD